MKTKIFTLSCILFAAFGFGQNFWSKTNAVPKDNLSHRQVQPKEFSLYSLKLEKIKDDLSKVPMRFSKDQSHVITLSLIHI